MLIQWFRCLSARPSIHGSGFQAVNQQKIAVIISMLNFNYLDAVQTRARLVTYCSDKYSYIQTCSVCAFAFNFFFCSSFFHSQASQQWSLIISIYITWLLQTTTTIVNFTNITFCSQLLLYHFSNEQKLYFIIKMVYFLDCPPKSK